MNTLTTIVFTAGMAAIAFLATVAYIGVTAA